MTADELAAALATPGRASLPYRDPHSPDQALMLECYRAPGHTPEKPVVLVQHGMARNGDEYCEAWVDAADRHGLLIVATTFPNESWPGSRTYNDGHVREEDGAVRARAAWSHAIPGRVFGLLRDGGVTTRERAYLWGHSAGGQFVHRALATQDSGLFEAAGAGNSGWYTMPTLDRPYPEGLGEIGLTEADIVRLLAYKLVIFAGDQDINTTEANLPRGPAAMAQGPHRFARAHNYLREGQAAAAARGVPCNWTQIVVPGVGHEGMRMSGISAAYWFDGKMPDAPAEPRQVATEL